MEADCRQAKPMDLLVEKKKKGVVNHFLKPAYEEEKSEELKQKHSFSVHKEANCDP